VSGRAAAETALDRDELAGFVKTHQAGVYRFLRYLGADRAAAEDLLQETFLTAVRHCQSEGMAEIREPAAWVRGVARNLFLARCRRQKVNPVVVNSEWAQRAEDLWQSEFLRDGDGSDYLEALRRCLAALPSEDRGRVDMQYTRGLSRSQMALATGMTEDGVKAALRRIRARLADCVGRRLNLAPGDHP
jgi:RNA polymerase sigma-70 factor, ECF subfamily